MCFKSLVQGRGMIEKMAEATLFCKRVNHQAELFNDNKIRKKTCVFKCCIPPDHFSLFL